MPIDAEQVLKTHLREQKYDDMVVELNRLAYGIGARISGVIAPGGVYSERATLAFIDDVLRAYSIYPTVVEDADNGWLEYGDSLDYDEEEALLDAEQARFLKSLLYCLLRLVADSPWYIGTFREFELACDALIGSFALGLPREEFWEFELGTYGGAPRKPADLGFGPMTVMSSWFPILEPLGEPPAAFLESLNWIYEALSGKPIVGQIPRKQRERLQKALDQRREEKEAERKAEEERRRANSKTAIEVMDEAFGHERDALKEALGDRLEAPVADAEFEDPEMDDSDWPGGSKEAYDEMLARDVAEREQWVAGFPRKEEWCKRYLAMRRSYFKLGGTGPIDVAGYPYAKPIDTDNLERAIESALDAHHVAHFTDDVFKVIHAKLRETVMAAQRAIAEGH